MTFAADHQFWQQRVDKEVVARNKFVETNFLKSSPEKSQAMAGDFNYYQIGESNPNQIRAREFKHNYRNVPLNVTSNTFEKLNALTQIGATMDQYVKNTNSKNDYQGYQQLKGNSDLNSRAKSQMSHKRKSITSSIVSQTILNGNKNPQPIGEIKRTFDGKIKRQRFNEAYDDNVSRVSGLTSSHSVQRKNHFMNAGGSLTQQKLESLPSVKGGLNDELLSRISRNSHNLKAATSIKSSSILNKKIKGETGDTKSDASKNYREKVINIINNLDDKKLQMLGKELNADNLSELDQETKDFINGLKLEDIASFDGKSIISGALDVGELPREDKPVSEIRSVITGDAQSVKTTKTSLTVLNNLEKQLTEEKLAREKLRNEIEELKKVNSELCNAILTQTTTTQKK